MYLPGGMFPGFLSLFRKYTIIRINAIRNSSNMASSIETNLCWKRNSLQLCHNKETTSLQVYF